MTIIDWLKDRFTNAHDAPECAAYELGCINESLDYGNDWRLAELLRNRPAEAVRQSPRRD